MLASGADVNELELAWAGGFFDGEGNSYFRWARQPIWHNDKTYMCFKSAVQIGQAHDSECVERFQRALGDIGKIRPYMNKHGVVYKWSVQAIDEVEEVLLALWPYISGPKRKQAGVVLEAIESRRASPYYSVSRKGMGGRPRKEVVSL